MGVTFSKPTLSPGQDSYGNGITGFETMGRGEASTFSSMTTSGRMFLAYATPQVARTVSTAVWYVGGTAAGTPTVIRFGLFTVDTNGDGTLVASTANDTSLMGSTNAEVTKALSSSYTLIPGQRYAAGLVVLASVMPSVLGGALPNATPTASLNTRAPKLSAILGSQTDLPASFLNSGLTNTGIRFYFALV